MDETHSILIGNLPLKKIARGMDDIIYLEEIGSRIVFDGLPFYVGQSIVDKEYPKKRGVIKCIWVSLQDRVPTLHCDFGDTESFIDPYKAALPIVNFVELERRADDFFDALYIGDTLDYEVYDNLYNMLPLLEKKAGYFQVSGAVGAVTAQNGVVVKTYLTVKQYGSELGPWRYIGHCARNADLHLGPKFSLKSRKTA